MYDADAVNGAVVLSARYIADRQLPDKAIDLMDEAGSRVRIAAHAARRKVLASGRLVADGSAPWMELQQVLEAKEEAIKVRVAGGARSPTDLGLCTSLPDGDCAILWLAADWAVPSLLPWCADEARQASHRAWTPYSRDAMQ